jgi:hypothetical protein
MPPEDYPIIRSKHVVRNKTYRMLHSCVDGTTSISICNKHNGMEKPKIILLTSDLFGYTSALKMEAVCFFKNEGKILSYDMASHSSQLPLRGATRSDLSEGLKLVSSLSERHCSLLVTGSGLLLLRFLPRLMEFIPISLL